MKQMTKSSVASLGTAFLILAGCSAKSGGYPEAPRPAAKPFEIEKSDQTKLENVGCHVVKSAISCDDPGIAITDENRLNDLTSYQRQLELQRQAVSEVQQSIGEKIKAGKLSSSESIEARLLSANMTGYGGELIKRSANKDVEIVNEKMFQLVVGYKCDGTYGSKGTPKIIAEMIPFPNAGSKDFEKTFEATGTGDLRGHLKVESQKHNISWGAADGSDGASRDLRHYVQTDGEFTAKAASISSPTVGCLKMRASGNATHFSDRPVKQRYWTCLSNSDLANPVDKSKPTTTGWSLSFNIPSDDVNKVSNLGGPDIDVDEGMKDFMNDSIYAKLKFGIRVTSNAGILKFELYDRESQKLLYEVTTVNSTPNISLGFEDKAGNAVRLQCGDGVKK